MVPYLFYGPNYTDFFVILPNHVCCVLNLDPFHIGIALHFACFIALFLTFICLKSPFGWKLACVPYAQSRSTPTSGPPPKVSARAPAHRSYHFRGVKLKSCIKKIHHNLYISKQANVRIRHADTEGASHKKFGTDARVQ